jgi:hypothetical protein
MAFEIWQDGASENSRLFRVLNLFCLCSYGGLLSGYDVIAEADGPVCLSGDTASHVAGAGKRGIEYTSRQNDRRRGEGGQSVRF